MRVSRSVAALAAGALLSAGALVVAATPAAAADFGAKLDGRVFLLANAGGLDANAAASVVTSGTGQTRPFQSATTDVACPAAATNIQVYVQIPQAGVPKEQWDATALTALSPAKDSQGRFYTGRGDTMSRATVVTWLSTQPGNTGTIPLEVICQGSNAGEYYGYFETMVTVSGTSSADFTWSVPDPGAYPGGAQQAQATTTTLAGAASGADLVLTATVSPASAAGQVTFTEGSTTLGSAPVVGGTASYTVTAPTQGAHTYTAAFAPADAAAYEPSSGAFDVTLGLDGATGQLVLQVPGAPLGEPGSLTFAVPFDVPVQLAGARSQDGTRITASAAFPTVTVTDTRRDDLLGHWQVNAQSQDFTGSAGVIGAKYLGWTPSSSAAPAAGSPLQTRNGGAVPSFLDDDTSTGLGTSRMLGESATPGRGVATLDARLNLAIPATTAEGQYTSVVTVTLVAD